MRVYDPIYGEFSLPSYIEELVFAPEVRRLSQIRLLNTLTPSLATLGELRRFSHTLGVLHLCQQTRLTGFSREEREALSASVLLHDIGTPPFGHLFEYHLRDSYNWNHERAIKSILWGQHVRENKAHQIFGGRPIEFRTSLKSVGISFDIVEKIVTGNHPLSLFLFGSIDLDNLDNIARMAWAIGLRSIAHIALELASALTVTRENHLCLANGQREKGLVEEWSSVRRNVYEIIVFDPPTVAAQAVLSEAIGVALEGKILDQDDSFLSDETLLDILRKEPATKDLIVRDYLGKLPTMAFAIQIECKLSDLGLPDRRTAKAIVEDIVQRTFPTNRVFAYVFIDKGSFEKELRFYKTGDEATWQVGQTSTSVVFYAFVRSRGSLTRTRCKRSAAMLLSRLKILVTDPRLKKCIIGPFVNENDSQSSLNFSTRKH